MKDERMQMIENTEIFKVMENIHDGVYVVDRDRKIMCWNKAAEQISGYSNEEMVGKYCCDNMLQHIDGNGCALCSDGCPLHSSIETGDSVDGKVYLHHKNGHRVAVSVMTIPLVVEEEVIAVAEIFSDSVKSDVVRENLNELRKESMNDSLTGIYNRRYMQMYLKTKVEEFVTFKRNFGVLFFDIDFFKNVNDTYGHNAGDAVLKMVALSARSVLRKSDVIARWGGEEFLILVDSMEFEDLEKKAESLRTIIEQSEILYDDKKIKVTVSVGATTIRDGDDDISVVDRSDKLMYESKVSGRNRISVK